jgi:hypothetical protein
MGMGNAALEFQEGSAETAGDSRLESKPLSFTLMARRLLTYSSYDE